MYVSFSYCVSLLGQYILGMTSEHVVSTILENVDGITNLAQRALKIKDEANQFFHGNFYYFFSYASN